jgi:two-component system, chemotaxis family, sensor kinase Cph1
MSYIDKNRDAEFCGRVPLHQTNLIQPHGVLLVVQDDDHFILQASENAEVLFGVKIQQLVSTRLTDHLESNDINSLQHLLASPGEPRRPFVFRLKSGNYLGIIHQEEGFYLVEFQKEERPDRAEKSFVSAYLQVKNMLSSIDATGTTDETCQVVARELKALSGFDKVMIYRFDKDWHGDVIAEEKEEGMDAYLGLKFPASDIPRQARELYKKTPYRLIPTTDYEPVRLYPVINPRTNAFTNLSNSNLRSVAAVHLEYLRNMQVKASMSTRILKDGELWGLIACHHREPRYVSYEMCAVFELISTVMTTKISAVQTNDLLAYHSAKRQELVSFMQAVYQSNNPADYKNALFSLLEADGLSIVVNRHVESIGKTPPGEAVEDLAYWLSSNQTKEVYHQPSLIAVYEPAEAFTDTASGLLAVPIDPEKGDFVMAFRSEALQKVDWGGNPSEAVQFEEDNKKYHPRASFRIWQETVRQTSMPWREELLRTARDVQVFLMRFQGVRRN